MIRTAILILAVLAVFTAATTLAAGGKNRNRYQKRQGACLVRNGAEATAMAEQTRDRVKDGDCDCDGPNGPGNDDREGEEPNGPNGPNGYGPGDGAGNDGDGPGDGTGYGPGECE